MRSNAAASSAPLRAALVLAIVLCACTSEVGPDPGAADPGVGSDGLDAAGGPDVAEDPDGTGGIGDGTDGPETGVSARPADDGVLFEWPATGKAHERLVVEQGGSTFTHAAPAGAHSVTVPHGSGYVAGPADFRLEASDDAGFTGAAIVHEGTWTVVERLANVIAGAVAPSDHTLEGLPAAASAGEEVTLSGNSGSAGLRATIFVGRPDGPVDHLLIGEQKNLPAGQGFSATYTFTKKGVYVVELLGTGSIPVLIAPVYCGGVVPLATPPLDVWPDATLAEPLPLEELRDQVRTLTNDVRAKLGLPALKASPAADASAQAEAQAMHDAKYFGHTGPDGKKAADFAAEAGLGGLVWDNIAVEHDAGRAWLLWYWSPSHRAAWFDSSWVSAGLGVALFYDDPQRLIFVQHLSTEAP